MNMTGYAPAMTNMAPQLNPQRSQIAALMGSRPGIPPTGQAMGMAPAAPQAMPPPMPAQNGLNLDAPLGQPAMGQAMSRPIMRMPQSMMR